MKTGYLLRSVSSVIFAAALVSGPVFARPNAQQSDSDNTRMNRDQGAPTADQQRVDTSDRELTQKIRKSVNEDKSLSTYAHNIKIISQNGRVTLRGPVRSEEEKSRCEAKAQAIAGPDHVVNELEVAQK